MKKLLIILLLIASNAWAYPPEVKAILGEAEGEYPKEGKKAFIAIGEAIRNRGNLKGVYGGRVIVESKGSVYRKSKKGLRKLNDKLVKESVKAWEESSKTNLTNGANGWGNDSDIKKFKQQGWWSDDLVTAKIGDHTFYRG